MRLGHSQSKLASFYNGICQPKLGSSSSVDYFFNCISPNQADNFYRPSKVQENSYFLFFLRCTKAVKLFACMELCLTQSFVRDKKARAKRTKAVRRNLMLKQLFLDTRPVLTARAQEMLHIPSPPSNLQSLHPRHMTRTRLHEKNKDMRYSLIFL